MSKNSSFNANLIFSVFWVVCPVFFIHVNGNPAYMVAQGCQSALWTLAAERTNIELNFEDMDKI